MNWLQIGLSAAAAFALSFLLHTVDVNRLEKKHEKAIAAQIAADTEACNNDKAIAKGANDDLLKSCTDRLTKLNAVRLQPARCVNVSPSKQTQPASRGDSSGRADGLSSEWLQVFSIEHCRRYYDERIVLEKFINETWKANGQ